MKTSKEFRTKVKDACARSSDPNIGQVIDFLDDIDTLEAHVAALEKKLEWYQSGDIHTCHDECKRPICVVRRENAALEARCAWQAGMLERAKEVIQAVINPGYSGPNWTVEQERIGNIAICAPFIAALSKGPGNE